MAKEVVIRLSVDAKGAVTGIRSAEGAMVKLDRQADRAQGGLGKLKSALQAVAAAETLRRLAGVAQQLFDLGSAATETGSKFDTVMGPAAARVDDQLRRFANTAGLTQTEARALGATFASVAQGMGETQEASADLSVRALQLAADFASFNNVPIEQAINAITAATVGEREALKTLGVVLTEAEVKAAEATKEFEGQSRAAVTLELITRKAGVAVGDLARTQDSAANRSRALQAELREVREEVAVALLPAFADLLEVGVDLVPTLRDMADAMTGAGEATTKAGQLVAVATEDFRDLAAVLGVGYDLITTVTGSLPSFGLSFRKNFLEPVRDAILPLNGMIDKLAEAARYVGLIKDETATGGQGAFFGGAGLPSVLDQLDEANRLADRLARSPVTTGGGGGGAGGGGAAGSVRSGADDEEAARRDAFDRRMDARALEVEAMRDGLAKELAEIDHAFEERVEAYRRGYGKLTAEEERLFEQARDLRKVRAQVGAFDAAGGAVDAAGLNSSVRGGDATFQAFDEAQKMVEALRDVEATGIEVSQNVLGSLSGLVGSYGGVLSESLAGISSLFAEVGRESEAAFLAYKAVAIAGAIVDTYGAANKALNSGLPPPLAAIAAAAAVATGLANVAAIRRAQPGGGATGTATPQGGTPNRYGGAPGSAAGMSLGYYPTQGRPQPAPTVNNSVSVQPAYTVTVVGKGTQHLIREIRIEEGRRGGGSSS